MDILWGEEKEKKFVKFMPYNALSCGHYSGLSSPRLTWALISVLVMASAFSVTRSIISGVEILGKFPLQNLGPPKKEIKKKVLFLNPTFEPNVFFSQFCDVAKSGDHHP